MNETALGRLVPEFDSEAVLDDAVVDLLFRFWAHPQNRPANAYIARSRIAQALAISAQTAAATIERLQTKGYVQAWPPTLQTDPEYRITREGVQFARTVPQGLASIL